MTNLSTLDKVNNLSAKEKISLVRQALYSEDHLLKILFRIVLIVDPENTEASLEWLKAQADAFSSVPKQGKKDS